MKLDHPTKASLEFIIDAVMFVGLGLAIYYDFFKDAALFLLGVISVMMIINYGIATRVFKIQTKDQR